MTDSAEYIEPIDPELARLLKSGAPELVAPAGASERLLSKLAISIPALGGPGPGGGGGGGGGGATATTAAAPAATKVIALIAAAVAIGGVAAGIAVSSAPRSPSMTIAQSPTTTNAPLVSSASSTALTSSDIPTVSIDSLPTTAAASIDKRAAPRSPSPSMTPSSSTTVVATAAPQQQPASGDVVEERRLVDGARGALARGDAAGAMTIIEDHEKRFASGVLVEEREAIAIRTLVAQKRTTEAEARATRFRAVHPKSLFLPSVDAALTPR